MLKTLIISLGSLVVGVVVGAVASMKIFVGADEGNLEAQMVTWLRLHKDLTDEELLEGGFNEMDLVKSDGYIEGLKEEYGEDEEVLKEKINEFLDDEKIQKFHEYYK